MPLTVIEGPEKTRHTDEQHKVLRRTGVGTVKCNSCMSRKFLRFSMTRTKHTLLTILKLKNEKHRSIFQRQK